MLSSDPYHHEQHQTKEATYETCICAQTSSLINPCSPPRPIFSHQIHPSRLGFYNTSARSAKHTTDLTSFPSSMPTISADKGRLVTHRGLRLIWTPQSGKINKLLQRFGQVNRVYTFAKIISIKHNTDLPSMKRSMPASEVIMH